MYIRSIPSYMRLDFFLGGGKSRWVWLRIIREPRASSEVVSQIFWKWWKSQPYWLNLFCFVLIGSYTLLQSNPLSLKNWVAKSPHSATVQLLLGHFQHHKNQLKRQCQFQFLFLFSFCHSLSLLPLLTSSKSLNYKNF